MSQILSVLLFITILHPMGIFDSSKNNSLNKWYIIDDNVMGGKSRSNITINESGNAVFVGSISLENNGGFCSVRHNLDEKSVADFDKISIRIKGDGKRYQFRIKENSNDYYSYVSFFETSGNWETIEIPLKDMYPVFRGRELNMSNFSGNSIEEVAFLIGNKKEETFRLEIEKIEIK